MSALHPLVQIGIQFVLVVLVILLVLSSYRVWRGPSPADRLQAIDTANGLLIGIIITLSLVQETALLIDVGIALAALGLAGTLAVSRYLSEGKVF